MNATDQAVQTPQFDTVEYAAQQGNCVLCNQAVGSPYYRVNGEQACSRCAETEMAELANGTKNYSRALLFGIGAAIVGLIGYATFAIVTGWVIGFLSLGVGWIVGKAMLKGSRGMGGRKYQITAVLLTYAAVSMSAIPVWVAQIAKEKKNAQPQAQVHVQPQSQSTQSSITQSNGDAVPDPMASREAQPAADTAQTGSDTTSQAAAEAKPEKAPMNFGKAIAMLVGIGLASPFLELASPLHGIIGLFILFIGMQLAWKMLARPKLQIDGPF
ncbi:MAG TPA: hypothetical protein VN577_22360 [Terriglobales bacterium]|nr:hypothetical protein [Terriglobales bacterium]